MERQQSHEMRVVTWLCEISLTPAWPQYADIPHPTRPLASSPAPGAGGSRGDTRGGPYPGAETHALAPSSGPPHTLDRGRYTPVGVGQAGRGQKTPSPACFQYDGKGREEGQTPLRISEL
jgi:hypothetical protein